jgi:lantibiotic modifying enzyme
VSLRPGFREHLSQQLVRLAARILVLELNVVRVTSGLVGDTPQERFAGFVHRYASGAGLRALLGEYAVLARLIGAVERLSDPHLGGRWVSCVSPAAPPVRMPT